MNLRSSSRKLTHFPSQATTMQIKQKKEPAGGKKQEVKFFPIHGLAGSIKRRRQSFEATRSLHMMKLRGTSTLFKEPKIPLLKNWTKENSALTASAAQCKHSSCPIYNSRRVCVIEKCEMWLDSRPLEQDIPENWDMTEEEEMKLEDEFIAKQKAAEETTCDQKQPKESENPIAVPILPVSLRQLVGKHAPAYSLQVRLAGMNPSMKGSPHRLVRGHCPYTFCNTTHPTIDWKKSGPDSFRNLLRPFCPNCSTEERRSYLDLYFYLEMEVVDKNGTTKTVIIQRETAMRFFGCPVYKYLTDKKCSVRVQNMLTRLHRKCKPSSSTKGDAMTFEVRVIPVATDSLNKVELHLFGDNEPLISLVKRPTPLGIRG